MKHSDQPSLNTCHNSIYNIFINNYLNNNLNRSIHDYEAQLQVILHLFIGDRDVTGWTNAAGSVVASNKLLSFHNLHLNMSLMK